jgi:hypothetical protein
MPIKALAIIRRETKVNLRKPNDKERYASLSLLNEENEQYGTPILFSGFPEVADLLKREAGVTHEHLQDCYLCYERGEEVRISLTLESEEIVRRLGFEPKAA